MSDRISRDYQISGKNEAFLLAELVEVGIAGDKNHKDGLYLIIRDPDKRREIPFLFDQEDANSLKDVIDAIVAAHPGFFHD